MILKIPGIYKVTSIIILLEEHEESIEQPMCGDFDVFKLFLVQQIF